MTEVIDKTARQRIDSHEELCALRAEIYNKAVKELDEKADKLEEKVDKLPGYFKKDIDRLQSTLYKLVIGLLGFVIVTILGIVAYQYDSIEKRNAKQLDIATEQALRKYKGYTGD